MPSGTLTMADLRANRHQSVAAFGLDTIAEILQDDLNTYNQITDEVFAELCDVTTDRQRIYGTSSADTLLEESDDFDRGVANKPPFTGVTVGFPLRKFVRPLGWNNDYFLAATPADLAEVMLGAQRAYTRTLLRDMKRAIFTPNNTTFFDRYAAPQINLTVRALLNADSADIPNGPNGETFSGATHSHYDFINSATPTAAGLTAQIADVVEHGHGEDVRIYINAAAETAVRALSGFVPYADPRIVYRNTDTPGTTLDITRLDNRRIGIFGAAEVWVKPWMPAGYTFCFAAGDTTHKPLVMRQHEVEAMRGLRVVSQIRDYPLYADQMAAYTGFGIWNRTNGHVLYYASGASAYVAPTITV